MIAPLKKEPVDKLCLTCGKVYQRTYTFSSDIKCSKCRTKNSAKTQKLINQRNRAI